MHYYIHACLPHGANTFSVMHLKSAKCGQNNNNMLTGLCKPVPGNSVNKWCVNIR